MSQSTQSNFYLGKLVSVSNRLINKHKFWLKHRKWSCEGKEEGSKRLCRFHNRFVWWVKCEELKKALEQTQVILPFYLLR